MLYGLVLITAHIHSMVGGYCFYRCVSVDICSSWFLIGVPTSFLTRGYPIQPMGIPTSGWQGYPHLAKGCPGYPYPGPPPPIQGVLHCPGLDGLVNSYNLLDPALKAVFLMSFSSMAIWRYPWARSKDENHMAAWTARRAFSVIGRGILSLMEVTLSLQISPVFFQMMTTCNTYGLLIEVEWGSVCVVCAVLNYHAAVDYTLTVESPTGIQLSVWPITADASLSQSRSEYIEYLRTCTTAC